MQTPRTINGTNFDGSAAITTANWGAARTLTIGNTGKSVNGSGNVTWSLSEIGAAAASHGTHVSYGGNGSATTVSRSDHSHSYLPLGGGTLSGQLTTNAVLKVNSTLDFAGDKSVGSYGPDGAYYSAQFTPMNLSGNCVLGYSAYTAKLYSTNIYGNNINFKSNGEINFDKQIRVPAGADGGVRFNNDDAITYNDSSNEYSFSKDGTADSAIICCGSIKLGGKRLSISTGAPSGPATGDIWIDI